MNCNQLFTMLLTFFVKNISCELSKSLEAEIQNIHVYKGRMFIGAQNRILEVDKDFNVLNSLQTGPTVDHIFCFLFLPDSCITYRYINKNPVEDKKDNNNQILMVTEHPFRALIACGNVNQGKCLFLNITTLKPLTLPLLTKMAPLRFYLASNKLDGSSLAMITRLGDKNVLVISKLVNAITEYPYTQRLVNVVHLDNSQFLQSNKFADVSFNVIYKKRGVVSRQQPTGHVSHVYNFMSSYQSGDYIYYFAVLTNKDTQPYLQSKVIRLKMTQKDFGFYIEYPLSCRRNGVLYNDLVMTSVVDESEKTKEAFGTTGPIVFALFKNSSGSQFAVCYFEIGGSETSIDKKMESVSAECKNKNSVPTATWFEGGFTCKDNSLSTTVGVFLAPKEKIFGTVLYTTSIEQGSMFAYSHERGVSLYLSATPSTVEEFLASSSGLYKYGEITFAANSGLFKRFVLNDRQLFLSGGKSLARFSITECSRRNTCKECLSGPACGWCTLQNSCSLAEQCPESSKANHFVTMSVDQCPKVTNIAPSFLGMTTRAVNLTVVNIPLDYGYKCSFNGFTRNVTLYRGSVFVCEKTPYDIIPHIDEQKDSVVNVSLVTSDAISRPVATSKLTVTLCFSSKMCTQCLRRVSKCGWCSEDKKCVDKQQRCSKQNTNFIPSLMPNSAFPYTCPRIESISQKLIPSGSSQQLVLKGKNLLDMTNSKYECKLTFPNETYTSITMNAVLQKSSVVCQSTKISYTEKLKSKTAIISLYHDSSMIDTSEIKGIEVYKCNSGVSDCTSCFQEQPKEWQCGWCKNKCIVQSMCSAGWETDKCPPPKIISFTPNKAPIKGSTSIQISGQDLGLQWSDVISVHVAEQMCLPHTTKPKSSQLIVCTVSNVDDAELEGTIKIKLNTTSGDTLNATSNERFFFRKPAITENLSPEVGPCSGGTPLMFAGENLDVGNHVSIKVNKEECKEITRTENWLNCTTDVSCNEKDKNTCKDENSRRRRRSITTQRDGVDVTIDSYRLTDVPAGDMKFKYTKDPLVTELYTNKESIIKETFASGGQVFYVGGQRLHTISNPKMTFFAYTNQMKRETDCTLTEYLTGKMYSMTCLSPNVSAALFPDRDRIIVNLGFVLDNVKNVDSYTNITVYRDPQVEPFPDNQVEIEPKNPKLILSGSGFSVLDNKDVTVEIGNSDCRVTDVGENLVCEVPEESVIEKESPNYSGDFPVNVYIGERGFGLVFRVGMLRFARPAVMSPWWYGGIAGIILIVLLFILVIFFMYRRQQKRKLEYEELHQNKVDQIEMHYARECKEAFADYQTTSSDDLTNEVNRVNLKPLEFREYAMRVLYPGLHSHPILDSDKSDQDEWKESMDLFIKLMKNESFLLTFIKTLESQSKFQMTDRCAVASLLLVSLQDDMQYTTKILIELVKELIKKSGHGKRPKLLLRRTESVAEKLLTIWLAYTLHTFLEKNVGEKLFKLYTSLNILLDKEPVDAITYDAKKSLSEDKLLRQKIDFTTLQINVEWAVGEEIQNYENISILSCDTITQTKEKIIKHIFKNSPYKEWPSPDNLSLGFVSANGAVLILQDEDSTNEVSGEWKKINTIDHFKVGDNSKIRIAPLDVAPSPYNGSGTIEVVPQSGIPSIEVTIAPSKSPVHSRSLKSLKRRLNASLHSISDLERSATLPAYGSTSTPMLAAANQLDELKLFHMVKVTDFPQDSTVDVKGKAADQSMVTEVYLTRLLKTKEILQPYVHSLFTSIFDVGNDAIPLAVKYLFDFLDTEAKQLAIDDSEVHHTWKNNSLPLRFWINMIKNPNFCFDVNKSNTVDSCLSVIAQLFMDSCSPDDHRLGKDSPANKLLYAKEIPLYKKIVKEYYADVRKANFDENAFKHDLQKISEKYGKSFNSRNAASHLIEYAVTHKVVLMNQLEDNDLENEANELQRIMEKMPDE